MINKADLIDSPERRSVPASQFEFRTGANNTLKFSGYASVFNRGYDVHGGANAGGWTEMVTRKAFDTTLKANPDVHLLINHDGLPLARTKSGTLRLGVDSEGLLSEADLDLRDHTVRSLAVKMERGDVDEMSFAFRVKRQEWNNDETERSLTEVSLHKGDVSIVSFGANPYTSATIRSAVERLANLKADELAELRAMSEDVDRAMDQLMAARKSEDIPADEQARTLLGTPGVSQNFTITYRRRKVPVTQFLYVYPRNLRSWLKLAPSRVGDFHPVTLRLDFSKDALVAISLGAIARVTVPPCKPSVQRRGFVRKGQDFPYGFHGLTLGATVASVEQRFGKFAGRASDLHVYLPVPFLVEGRNTVSGLRIATGAPFEARGDVPDFQLKLDPRSCLVTGLVMAAGR